MSKENENSNVDAEVETPVETFETKEVEEVENRRS